MGFEHSVTTTPPLLLLRASFVEKPPIVCKRKKERKKRRKKINFRPRQQPPKHIHPPIAPFSQPNTTPTIPFPKRQIDPPFSLPLQILHSVALAISFRSRSRSQLLLFPHTLPTIQIRIIRPSNTTITSSSAGNDTTVSGVAFRGLS